MPQKQVLQRSLKELFFSISGYVVVLILSVFLLRSFEFARLWQILISITPALPVAFVIITLMRALRDMDELQQRVHLQATTFSAVLTGFITFSYGLLENVGFPKLPTFAIFPMLFVLWGVGLSYFTTRYE